MTDNGISRIKRLLPHRFPMLLVDRIVEFVPGEHVIALKAVTCNEPWYQELPDEVGDEDCDYPVVLLFESWCQSAGLLVTNEQPNPDVLGGRVMLHGGASGVRYTGRVRPGDVVQHRARLVRALSDTAIFAGESVVSGETVMEVGQVVMTMRASSELAAGDAREVGS